MRHAIAAALIGVALPTAAVASDADAQLRQDNAFQQAEARLAAVSFRLATRAANLCSRKSPSIGIFLRQLSDFSLSDRAEAIRLYGLDRGVGVSAVAPASPAAVSGIEPGDVIVAVNDAPLPDTTQIDRTAASSKLRSFFQSAMQYRPILLRRLRAGTESDAFATPVVGCALDARLAMSKQLNAFASEGQVVIPVRFALFTASDDELAVAVAHEYAHIELGHHAADPKRDGEYRTIRGKAVEEAADRLGLRMAHAAGYDISAAIGLWRRFYGAKGPVPAFLTRHPGLARREAIVREVMAELGAPNAP
ncbi:M48 family metalloprotease [Allosphingosinicella indica]|uniref:PDZ domain-containing protein n=1 Tax=Allosphingosinicella indica TaxID=941907 RepID=A0A1X7G1H0_9SPHN|nr:M48 family metalloprotease [Allosphingosinicella indica]SMF62326.1 PDZ domain-containing protein [Allosphingosinicella indica]